MNFNWLYAQDKTTIIYIGDPMCSWCYGFAPEISKIKEHYPNFDFRLIMGGLRPNGTETMNDLSSFLKHHWEDVNKASNQPFKYDILKDKEFIYDTEPACRATIVARKMNPEKEFEFFKAIQTAFYAKNKNTNSVVTYLEIAESIGLDKSKFKELFESVELKTQIKEDFELARSMGITGYPAVIISENGKLTIVSKGYLSSSNLIKNINKVIK